MSLNRLSLALCAASATIGFGAVVLTYPVEAQQTGSKSTVDESAIRYYARQGDQKRLEAEIARLRALYPEWTPPENLDDNQPQVDAALDRYWKLFSEGRFSEVRSAIAERRSKEPEWTPPAELIARLDEGEARQRLANASDNKQWASVLSLAAESSTLLTCANVDSLWRVAEAFARTGRTDRARDAYLYVLNNCNDTGERYATMQKAADVLPQEMMPELRALERKDAQGQGEFAALRDDELRRQLGKAAEDTAVTVDTGALADFTTLAKGNDNAADALILGWYNLRHGSASEALSWFQTAQKREDDDKASEGTVLSLIALKRFAEAEQQGYDRRNASDANRAAYFDAVTSLLALDPPVRIETPVIARIVEAINAARNVDAAQGLGWYSYNIGQTRSAETWFAAALSWQPDSEPSAYGLTVARQRLGDRAGVAALKQTWSARSPRIAGVGRPGQRDPRPERIQENRSATEQPLQRGTMEARDEQYAPVASTRTYTAQAQPEDITGSVPQQSRVARPSGGTCASGGTSGSAALNRGWCLLDLGRPLEAAAAFDAAMRTGSAQIRSDAAYGKSLAYLREGLTSEAAAAAVQAPVSAERGRDLNISILTQRALAAHRDGRYVETILLLDERSRLTNEDTGLMALRGWSYFHLSRWNDAGKIFKALASVGVKDGYAGMAAIEQSISSQR